MKNLQKIKPREYQIEAIESWKNSDYSGILEMATGTGKTITSLLAAQSYNSNKASWFIVIVVPFQHLVNQWEEDINTILDTEVIKCMGSKTSWTKELRTMVQEFNLNLVSNFVVVTTYRSVISTEFTRLIGKVNGNSMFIADECHYITQRSFRYFPFEKFDARLGLSATPDRWWDDEGTSYLKKKMGPVVYEYSLIQAIKNGKLTPYKYFPHIVKFREDEMEKYNKITLNIIRCLNNEDINDKEKLETLYRQRASLLYTAKNKIKDFLNDFKKEDLLNLTHTLVYCAPGEINILVKKISELGVKVSKFNSEVKNKDRIKILEQFENGKIQVLVAIKCLDEGVDIPATRTAYFLSSTSNPREFVQRRGRILRKYKDKPYANVHDYIVLPIGLGFDNFCSIASKEFPRFSEFNEDALNSTENKLQMYNILEEYNLVNIMYKKPWEVYREMKELFDNVESQQRIK